MSKHFWHDDASNDGGIGPKCFRMVQHGGNKVGDYRFNDYDCATEFRYICEQN